MVVYGLKPAFRRVLGPVMGAVNRFHPNTVSLFAVLFAAAAGCALAFAEQRPWLLLVTTPLLFLRIACNALDGMVAQARGMASARGELVNEASDRVNDALIFGGLALSGLVPAALALGILALAMAVSYLGILSKAAGGPRLYTGPFGKADRMLILGLGCILAYALPQAWAVAPETVLAWTLWASLALGLATLILRGAKAWVALGGPR